jgi:hypothetical protein
MNYMTLSEMAQELGLKDTTPLRRLCEAGVFAGAEKKGKTWLVPVESVDWYRRERLGKRGTRLPKHDA